MMGRFLLCGFLLLAPTAATAQSATPRADDRTSSSRIAKWVLAAAAVGFGAYAISSASSAHDAREALRDHCGADPSRCERVGGRYLDATTAALDRRYEAGTRGAQVGIFGSQLMLLGSVTFFVHDLRAARRAPDNIPYSAPPPPQAAAGGVAIGIGLTF